MTPAQFQKHIAGDLPRYSRSLDPEAPLDHWITYAVMVLRESGIETYESCQGGPGHAFSEPTVRFYGAASEGYRAASVALQHGLPVSSLRRFWRVLDGELEGPNWEITFRSLRELRQSQRIAEKAGLLS